MGEDALRVLRECLKIRACVAKSSPSSPRHATCKTLTPPWLKFEVLTPAQIVLRPGTLIDYRITVRGLHIRWRTEIAEWDPPQRFVDVQIRGPYTLWHHTHIFEDRDGSTLCGNVARYRPRGGALVHWLFVRRDVERIFGYRQQRLRELFGSEANHACLAVSPVA